MNELTEDCNKKIASIKKDIDTIQKNQSEVKKHIISKMRNTLEGITVGWIKKRIESATWKTR